MFNTIKISLYLHIKDPKYFRYIEMFIDDTSNTFDLIELPEILGNWNFWIIYLKFVWKDIDLFNIYIKILKILYFEMFIDDTSNTIDLIELPEILGNWNFWII